MGKYKLPLVEINERYYKVDHEFTTMDIEEILTMEEVGIPVSFEDAYKIRFLENFKNYSLANTKAIRESLVLFIKKKGMYIKFNDIQSNIIH